MLIIAVSTTEPQYLMTSHVCFWQFSRKLFLFLFSVLKLLLYDTTSEYAQKLWNFIVYHEKQIELETFSYKICTFKKNIQKSILLRMPLAIYSCYSFILFGYLNVVKLKY